MKQPPLDSEVLTVSTLTRRIKSMLEEELPEVWVRGEVSNFRLQSSGHAYFSLKDGKSQVSGVIFRGDATRLGLALADGMAVIAFGRISVYEPRGSYQLIVRYAIEDGRGRLQLEFERLKAKLAAEDLFNPGRKLPLPTFARTIGFVTSPTGAAIQDFVSILQRRGWRGRLIVLPTKVQGAGAAEEIVQRLQFAEELGLFDLIVVGRGGGSLEDLWPFNEEIVARAVAHCGLPVLSAVGHEIDFTLSDLAASKRAETPSAAAEMISSEYLEVMERLGRVANNLEVILGEAINRYRTRLELLSSKISGLSPIQQVEQFFIRLDDLENRIRYGLLSGIEVKNRLFQDHRIRLAAIAPNARVRLVSVRLESLRRRFQRAQSNSLDRIVLRLKFLLRRLENASPNCILERGFVIVSDENGTLIVRKEGVKPGQILINRFADGELPVKTSEK
tara:strand:+ start:4219 stop:5559 length:1341 start_codon:yes stop_codon:yes gene_type:complete